MLYNRTDYTLLDWKGGKRLPVPSIGQLLRVRMQDNDSDVYRSKLVESSSEYYFIDIPIHLVSDTSIVNIPSKNIWIEFSAVDGALCRFQSKVTGIVNEPVPMWKIQRPHSDAIYREQRREFLRVFADIPVTLEFAGQQGRVEHIVFTRDISGGGLGLLLPKEINLRVGSTVRTRFELSRDDTAIDVRCMVVRVSERNDLGVAVGSLQFLDLSEASRQKIIQYTFWRQRYLKDK
jgi:c-di-GMP-binding flagellar brake protein YcgR